MDKLNDKTYVMTQLRRATELGKFNEALSLIAQTEQGDQDAATNWSTIRREIDRLLASVPLRQTNLSSYEVSFEDDAHADFDKWAASA